MVAWMMLAHFEGSAPLLSPFCLQLRSVLTCIVKWGHVIWSCWKHARKHTCKKWFDKWIVARPVVENQNDTYSSKILVPELKQIFFCDFQKRCGLSLYSIKLETTIWNFWPVSCHFCWKCFVRLSVYVEMSKQEIISSSAKELSLGIKWIDSLPS